MIKSKIKSKDFDLYRFVFVSVFVLSACSPKAVDSPPQNRAALEKVDFANVVQSGGPLATSKDANPTSHGYRYPIPTLTEKEHELHMEGDQLFEQHFSDDPQRPEFGLGPVFNNTSCISCHNRDGRGSLPVGLKTSQWTQLKQNEAIFLRISIENKEILSRTPSFENHYNQPVDVPGFSTQLFHLGAYLLREESPGVGQAEVWIKLKASEFVYPDGKKVQLVQPIFKIEKAYDALLNQDKKSRLEKSDVRLSPRMGMPVYGLGLLEAIPEEEILKQAQKDFSREGVHGKVNWVFDIEKATQGTLPALSLGRFGLKSNTPSVLHQSLGALNGDMGVTNSYFPKESIESTPLFDKASKSRPSPLRPEASDEVSEALVFYSRTLAVPERRNVSSLEVQAGAKLFHQVGCTSCHRPSWTTGDSDIASLTYQKIYPFSDMLLHDMGAGLADGRQDFLATGNDWRTRPLWGIGLTQVVNPRAGFLHDGRARTLEEAILWHGGEAQYSRKKFTELNATQRKQLISFLESL